MTEPCLRCTHPAAAHFATGNACTTCGCEAFTPDLTEPMFEEPPC